MIIGFLAIEVGEVDDRSSRAGAFCAIALRQPGRTRERRSGRRRGSAPVRDCAGNAIQAVGLRVQMHPTRSYRQTLCPRLEIETESRWGEEPHPESWYRREVDPLDQTLESPW